MGPYYYVLATIKGDYAYLKRTDIVQEEDFMIAVALLPDGVDIDTKIKYENLEYSIID